MWNANDGPQMQLIGSIVFINPYTKHWGLLMKEMNCLWKGFYGQMLHISPANRALMMK